MKHLITYLKTKFLLLPGCMMLLGACSAEKERSFGSIERLEPGLDSIIDAGARVEVIAEGFNWCEGPLWVEEERMLLFSDVPENTVYKWTAEAGLESYLSPSGYTGSQPRGGETGSNGLLLNKEGKLLLCQHGDRRLARMNAPLDQPAADFTPVAVDYEGKKFNSPNDAVQRSNGDLFFTDPPYGMENGAGDPAREISFHGVYKVDVQGRVSLLTDSISRPNGIALTPDEKTLMIANSDPEKPVWYTFDLDQRDSLVNPGILMNVSGETADAPGLPDGMKIGPEGTIFASGPGGIWIFGKDRTLLGKIKVNGVASNCALDYQRKTLYITADSLLLRVKMQ